MKKKQVKKRRPKVDSTEELRKTYLQNREFMLEAFDSSLKEVQKDKPSVGGKIAGMDFQQFSAISIFIAIKDQEEYIDYAKESSPKYVDWEEETLILKGMIKKAKAVFKKDYNSWYELYAKR